MEICNQHIVLYCYCQLSAISYIYTWLFGRQTDLSVNKNNFLAYKLVVPQALTVGGRYSGREIFA